MKTELQIARENIKESKKLMKNAPSPDLTTEAYKTSVKGNTLLGNIKSHKASCKRFLEFLTEALKEGMKADQVGTLGELIKNKITDIKNTIKLYEENGI